MIVFFLPNGIGDTLMAVPVLRRLIDAHGAERISVVLASRLHQRILKQFTGHELQTFERFDGKAFPHLRLFVRLLLSRIDVIYAPLLSRRLKHIAFFLLLGKRIVAPASFVSRSVAHIRRSALSQANYDGHQVNYLVRFVATYDPQLRDDPVNFLELAPGTTPTPRSLPAPRAARRIAVGISCGALERHKIPSPLLFAKVLNHLSRCTRIQVLLIGTQGDATLNAALRMALDQAIEVNELIDQPLPAVIAALAECDIGVSGTTGQGHMMAAAQLPLLVLSGVTDPFESGPFAERVANLRHHLACGPCYQETFRFGCGKVACMEGLDPVHAADLALRLLEDPEFGRDWHSGHRIGAIPVHTVRGILSSHATTVVAPRGK